MKFYRFFVFAIAVLFTSSVQAEYYAAETPCAIKEVCVSCTKHKVHKHQYHHYSSYQHKKSQRNSYSISVYYYYPLPACSCADVWVPGHCACGRYVSGHWQTERREYVTFDGRPTVVHSYHETWNPPVDDRATRDDYNADMQIN